MCKLLLYRRMHAPECGTIKEVVLCYHFTTTMNPQNSSSWRIWAKMLLKSGWSAWRTNKLWQHYDKVMTNHDYSAEKKIQICPGWSMNPKICSPIRQDFPPICYNSLTNMAHVAWKEYDFHELSATFMIWLRFPRCFGRNQHSHGWELMLIWCQLLW